MRYIDKKFMIGFLAGFICFPIVAVVVGYIYFSYEGLNPPEIIPIEKQVHLNWEVKTLDGETVNLERQFEGKAVFLNFWATWCPPCTQEMPSIERLYGKYKGKIAFACVSNESIKDLKAFADKKGYTMPIYHIDGRPPEALGVKGIPLTYIISDDRRLSFKHIGGADWAHESVVAYFEKMLNHVD